MEFVWKIFTVLTLILLQVTSLPVHLAFTVLFSACLYFEETLFAPWLIFISLFLAVFSGLGFGIVLLSYTLSFGLLKLISSLVPKNNLARVLLILLALPLSEFSLVYFLKTFS